MKTAIINLDIINEITHQDGKISSYADRIEREGIIDHINQINKWARSHNHLVIHVRVGFDSNYTHSSSISPIFKNAEKNNALNLNEWGCQYHDSLHVEPSDMWRL